MNEVNSENYGVYKDIVTSTQKYYSVVFARGVGKSFNYIWEAYEGAWLRVEAERVRDLWLSGWSNVAWRVMSGY